jgi:hypothetical protein
MKKDETMLNHAYFQYKPVGERNMTQLLAKNILLEFKYYILQRKIPQIFGYRKLYKRISFMSYIYINCSQTKWRKTKLQRYITASKLLITKKSGFI